MDVYGLRNGKMFGQAVLRAWIYVRTINSVAGKERATEHFLKQHQPTSHAPKNSLKGLCWFCLFIHFVGI